MPVPSNPKIYHIVHVDRLPSIIEIGQLWCDAEMVQRGGTGTAIGMDKIKQWRRGKLLNSHPNLHVGNCVPFYFCPRSVMLYVIYKKNRSELSYRGGQGHIVHLEADLKQTVSWAEEHGLRWAFTLSNASSDYFEDRCNLAQLNEINWGAVQAEVWRQDQDKKAKQAEFLIEQRFPWKLVSRIGVQSKQVYYQASVARKAAIHKPLVEIKPEWYYDK